MQPDYPTWADPAEEVLFRLQPSFIQLAAVPVIEDPVVPHQDSFLPDE